MICIGSTWNRIIKNIEVVLKSIYNWLSSNYNIILLNCNKSIILINSLSEEDITSHTLIHDRTFHETNCTTIDYNNYCDCNSVSIVKNCRYLGIEMCSNTKWINHIKSIPNKLRKILFIQVYLFIFIQKFKHSDFS